jgi:hypothetical protein
MPQTLAAADAALQDDYVEPIVRAIKQKSYLLDQIKSDSSKLDSKGRKAVWDIHFKRNRGRGSRGTTEGAVLPVAGQQGYEDASVRVKYNYWAIEITDAAIEATSGSENAFVDLLEEETKAIPLEANQEMNRQAWGDGSGLLCKVTATSTGAVVTVDNTQWLLMGDPLTIAKFADGSSAATRTIVSIDYTNKQVTLDSSMSVDNTFGLYIAGNRSNEIDGVRNIFDKNRTIYGVPATVPQIQSRVTDMAGALAGENSFQLLRDSINRRGNGKVGPFLTTLGVRRRLAGTFTSQKRYNDAQAVEIHAGYTAIYVDENPVIADEDGQKGEVLAMTKDALVWVEQAAPGWLKQKDGTIFHLKDDTTPGQKQATWQAYFKWYCNLASYLPAKGGRLTNCQDDDYEGE